MMWTFMQSLNFFLHSLLVFFCFFGEQIVIHAEIAKTEIYTYPWS